MRFKEPKLKEFNCVILGSSIQLQKDKNGENTNVSATQLLPM